MYSPEATQYHYAQSPPSGVSSPNYPYDNQALQCEFSPPSSVDDLSPCSPTHTSRGRKDVNFGRMICEKNFLHSNYNALTPPDSVQSTISDTTEEKFKNVLSSNALTPPASTRSPLGWDSIFYSPEQQISEDAEQQIEEANEIIKNLLSLHESRDENVGANFHRCSSDQNYFSFDIENTHDPQFNQKKFDYIIKSPICAEPKSELNLDGEVDDFDAAVTKILTNLDKRKKVVKNNEQKENYSPIYAQHRSINPMHCFSDVTVSEAQENWNLPMNRSSFLQQSVFQVNHANYAQNGVSEQTIQTNFAQSVVIRQNIGPNYESQSVQNCNPPVTIKKLMYDPLAKAEVKNDARKNLNYSNFSGHQPSFNHNVEYQANYAQDRVAYQIIQQNFDHQNVHQNVGSNYSNQGAYVSNSQIPTQNFAINMPSNATSMNDKQSNLGLYHNLTTNQNYEQSFNNQAYYFNNSPIPTQQQMNNSNAAFNAENNQIVTPNSYQNQKANIYNPPNLSQQHMINSNTSLNEVNNQIVAPNYYQNQTVNVNNSQTPIQNQMIDSNSAFTAVNEKMTAPQTQTNIAHNSSIPTQRQMNNSNTDFNAENNQIVNNSHTPTQNQTIDSNSTFDPANDQMALPNCQQSDHRAIEPDNAPNPTTIPNPATNDNTDLPIFLSEYNNVLNNFHRSGLECIDAPAIERNLLKIVATETPINLLRPPKRKNPEANEKSAKKAAAPKRDRVRAKSHAQIEASGQMTSTVRAAANLAAPTRRSRTAKKRARSQESDATEEVARPNEHNQRIIAEALRFEQGQNTVGNDETDVKRRREFASLMNEYFESPTESNGKAVIDFIESCSTTQPALGHRADSMQNRAAGETHKTIGDDCTTHQLADPQSTWQPNDANNPTDGSAVISQSTTNPENYSAHKVTDAVRYASPNQIKSTSTSSPYDGTASYNAKHNEMYSKNPQRPDSPNSASPNVVLAVDEYRKLVQDAM